MYVCILTCIRDACVCVSVFLCICVNVFCVSAGVTVSEVYVCAVRACIQLTFIFVSSAEFKITKTPLIEACAKEW